MTEARFPQRRADGTFSVAARFSVSHPGVLDAVRERVSAWAKRKAEVDHADLGVDLSGPVRVKPRGAGGFDVVFDCRPESRLWKGFLVELVQEIRATLPDVTLLGF